MELVSKIHGTMKYDSKDVITFKKGIPGFQEYKEYVLLDLEGNEPFKILHSLENDELAFVVISPFEVKKDYEIELKEDIKESLNLKSYEDVLILTTVTLNSKVQNITTNLCAPLIININENIGEQIILDNNKYKIKQPLLEV